MDPFLEAHWYDVHSRLINQISEQIAGQLPEDLIVSIEKSITKSAKRANVDLSEWCEGDWSQEYDTYDPGDGSVAITDPVAIIETEIPHRHLEVRSLHSGNSVVTVIEILSPANKANSPSGTKYLQKRQTYLESMVNFVEIDLLRYKGPLHYIDPLLYEPTPYQVIVKRLKMEPQAIQINYEDRLPRFRIPLRPKDLPAILDLQVALDDCYRAGQYWKRVNYQNDKLSPRPSAETAEWIESVARVS